MTCIFTSPRTLFLPLTVTKDTIKMERKVIKLAIYFKYDVQIYSTQKSPSRFLVS